MYLDLVLEIVKLLILVKRLVGIRRCTEEDRKVQTGLRVDVRGEERKHKRPGIAYVAAEADETARAHKDRVVALLRVAVTVKLLQLDIAEVDVDAHVGVELKVQTAELADPFILVKRNTGIVTAA